MKNLFALILTVVVSVTGLGLNAFSQKPQGPNVAEAAGNVSVSMPAEAESGNAYFTVGAFSTRYHTYRMSAGESIRIDLVGDGSTDLDMYVYASNGSLICSRQGASDIETCYIDAYGSGTITIKVVNRGSVYNLYDVSVWTL
jgi:hypothetical protein